ncbi:MAG TPA: VOC family protein [Cytophagaceae bacterium]
MTIKQIKETSLYVKDLNETRKFYQGKLDLEIISEVKDRHIFFRAGTSALLCFIPETTQKESSLPSHFGHGHLHIAFEITPRDYSVWKEKVLNAGISIIHEQEWKNHLKSFYFRDPDEHLLEIVPEGIWD